MKRKSIVAGLIMAASLVCLGGCGKETTYQKEITKAWTQTNSYDSANYIYSNSYTNADGAKVSSSVEGAYNRTEEVWSQISAYGTQGIGKQEEVFSPDGVFIRYNLDGETWEEWGELAGEKPDYATYLTNLFEQEISFENFASTVKEETEGETVYTLTYEKNYMETQVNEDLQAAEAYLEVLQTSGAEPEEIEYIEARVDNLKLMAGAQGQVIYYVDKDGNLTGIGSEMTMTNGAGTSALLRVSDFGEVSFENYTKNP